MKGLLCETSINSLTELQSQTQVPILTSKVSLACADIKHGFGASSVWLALGWNDVRSRYNRSNLGVFWASLSILIFVAALGPVYSQLMNVTVREYTLHLLLGLMVWGYLSSIIMECGREFINSSSYLVSFRLSYFTLLLRVVWRNLVVFAYQFIVFIGLSLLLGNAITLQWLLLPIALILVTVNLLWCGVLMSIVAARFRDMPELMNNVLRLLFFITPIMWMPHSVPELLWVAEFNPAYYLIEIVRAPLTGASAPLWLWLVPGTMAISGWLIAFPVFVRYRDKIAFWL